MSVPVRSVAGLLALLAVGCAGSIAAQAAPEGRAWTDPPVRGSAHAPDAAATVVDTAPKPEASKEASTPHAVAPVRKAVAPKRRVAAIKPRIEVVRPVAVVRARPAPPLPRIAARPRPPAPRPVRYGFVAPPPPPGMLYVESSRAGRIRQAEAAGYLVMRRTTYAAPDGRLLYGYGPYDADE